MADVLAHVTLPYQYNKPYPLEPYLASGCWRRLFEGLLNPLRQDTLLSAGIAVTSVLGLAVGSLYTRLHLPITNTRIDAFVEGAMMFLVLTSVWLAAFLIRRRRLQPAV